MMKTILLLILIVVNVSAFAGQEMSQRSLEEYIKSISTNAHSENGVVEFTYNEMPMYLISDEPHNRMRIITPVIEYAKISDEQKDILLASNFHAALDARYAMSKGILFAAFIHPLNNLTNLQVKSAVIQVYNLRKTFGTEYSSGFLTYGAGKSEKETVQPNL